MDSNHRKRKLSELQSDPFGHSGNCPFFPKCDAKVIKFSLYQTDKRIFLSAIYSNQAKRLLINN